MELFFHINIFGPYIKNQLNKQRDKNMKDRQTETDLISSDGV